MSPLQLLQLVGQRRNSDLVLFSKCSQYPVEQVCRDFYDTQYQNGHSKFCGCPAAPYTFLVAAEIHVYLLVFAIMTASLASETQTSAVAQAA